MRAIPPIEVEAQPDIPCLPYQSRDTSNFCNFCSDHHTSRRHFILEAIIDQSAAPAKSSK